jgi:hypothetical protein
VLIIGKRFCNTVFLHDVEGDTISMAPLLVFALGIEQECLIKLLAGLRDDGGVGMRA